MAYHLDLYPADILMIEKDNLVKILSSVYLVQGNLRKIVLLTVTKTAKIANSGKMYNFTKFHIPILKNAIRKKLILLPIDE